MNINKPLTVATIIDRVIAAEGGYSKNPADKGGETMYGITVAVARANGYHGAMRDLPLDLAKHIYNKRYVIEPKFDQVAGIDLDVGMELIDTGVNMGPHRAAEFLQRWLNGFNFGGQYQELFIDGRVGTVTLDALDRFLRWRKAEGTAVLLKALNGLQAARYLEITERDKSQRMFLFGWVRERV